MTFEEWWVSDGVPSTAHLSVRQQGYRLIAEAAWNAALEEAARKCREIATHIRSTTNIHILNGHRTATAKLCEDEICALKEKP